MLNQALWTWALAEHIQGELSAGPCGLSQDLQEETVVFHKVDRFATVTRSPERFLRR